MANQKVNKAHFLISKFLTSPFADKYKLCGNAQSLLRYLGDLMDANLNNIGKRECSIKLSTLAFKSGMSPKPAHKYIDQLVENYLLEIPRKLEKNISVYILGKLFSVWENLPNCKQVSLGDLAISYGDLDNQLGRISLTHIYNTNYNTNYNTFNVLKTSKADNQKPKPSLLLEEYMNK